MRIPEDADNSAQDWLRVWVTELEARHYSRSALDQARLIVPRFLRHLEGRGVHELAAITEEHVASYLNVLDKQRGPRGQLFSLATKDVYLRTVRTFLSFLERRGAVLRNVAVDFKASRVKRLPPRGPSAAAVKRVMEAPSAFSPVGLRDRAILETLYGTAIRSSECARLDLADLDLHAGALLVRNGKGRKDRLVPVLGRAHAALVIYLRDARGDFLRDPKQSALFVVQGGRRLSPSTLQAVVKAYGRVAGLRLYPHALRHACATHMLRGGASIRHVQVLLGHAHLETTAMYTGVTLEDLERVLQRSHPRQRGNKTRVRRIR